MSEERKEKILKACGLVKEQDEKESDLTSLVAQSMQVGYELGYKDGLVRKHEGS